MFNKKPKTKELPSGEDLFNKLTRKLKKNINVSPMYLITAATLTMDVEKYHVWSYKRGPGKLFHEWKGVFLTRNNEAGIFHLTSKTCYLAGHPYDLYLAYVSNHTLHLQKNKLEYFIDEEHTQKKFIKQNKFYSLYFDEVYNPKKKIERINNDLNKGVLRTFAKQLIKQKIRRFQR